MMKKNIVIFTLVTLLSTFVFSMPVKAADHISGCDSEKERVVCGAFVDRPSAGSHVLYVTHNGNVTCVKRYEIHLHNVYCGSDKCNALLISNQARTCAELHSVCPDRTGMCQK